MPTFPGQRPTGAGLAPPSTGAVSAEASGSPTPGPPRPKRPSAGRLILESVAVALISVIVTKLVERVSGSEMSAAVLGGIAAGCVALLLGVRLKGRGAPPKAG